MLPLAEELGITLALENGRSLAHLVYIAQLIDRLDHPQLGYCLDSGHADLGDLGAIRAARMMGSLLKTTHLHDNRGQFDDHMPPGTASLDWEGLFEALHDIGYPGPLMLELTDRPHDRAYNQDQELATGLANTQRFASQFLR